MVAPVNPASNLPDDWWTTADAAEFLGVTSSTIRAYLARGQMLVPDRQIGRMRLWRPSTIEDWNRQRPRKAESPTDEQQPSPTDSANRGSSDG